MSATPTIHKSLHPFVTGLLDGDFDIHVPRSSGIDHTVWYVYVTKAEQPGCVLVQVPAFPLLGQSPEISVPVHPTKEYGSAVAVDFAGDPLKLVAVLAEVIERSHVITRFVADPRKVPVDKRIPATAVTLHAQEAIPS